MTQIAKLNLLLKADRKLFHTQDLALLWSVGNRNTLYTVIKRYVKKGILIKITKGLYSTLPLEQIELREIASALIHRFCYLSCESVLEEEGVISQKVYPLTFVSSLSKKIEFKQTLFVYRKLDEKYLLNPEGVEKKGDYFMASKERAVADMIYFNHKYYFDSPSLINWDRVSEIQRKVGYRK